MLSKDFVKTIPPQTVLSKNELNFSGGPGALPESVLQAVRASITCVPEVGLSILGISHRSQWFTDLVLRCESQIRSLLGVPSSYHILFLQGGATQQFSTTAAAFNHSAKAPAEYLDTGYWSAKSIESAKPTDAQRGDAANIRVAWSGKPFNYTKLPLRSQLELNPDAAYFHYVSNETVEGLQFHELMGLDTVPRICDMSSDFLSRPIEASRYALIYAHAQKNLGPAGVTIVVIKDEMLERVSPGLPSFLDYRNHVSAHSVFNTPPVFAIYVVSLITQWLTSQIGGTAAMHALNQAKAGLIYNTLQKNPDFYINPIPVNNRSLMNVTFKLPTSELERLFLEKAETAGFSGLGGHRSVGGVRASLYNGVTLQATQELARFMIEFHRTA